MSNCRFLIGPTFDHLYSLTESTTSVIQTRPRSVVYTPLFLFHREVITSGGQHIDGRL